MPSPLLHAPSLAQHRFVALMALCFLGSMVWSAVEWWQFVNPIFFCYAVGMAVYVGIQLLAQGKVAGWARGSTTPAWAKFFAAAAAASIVLKAIELSANTFFAIYIPGSHLLAGIMNEWILGAFLWLAGWYGAWWLVLRKGWVDAPTSLIAAGLHCSLLILGPTGWISSYAGGDIVWMIPVGLFSNASGVRGLEWLWLGPVGFFGGWGLMVLPAMMAARECLPVQRELGEWATAVVGRIPPALMRPMRCLLVWTRLSVACLAPAVAGLTLTSPLALPFYFLPGDWSLR